MEETNQEPQETKTKTSKKQIIGMVVLSIIAIAGVAFGIFGVTDSNSKSQEIENLKVQVAEADGLKAELETITNPDGTTTEITDRRNPIIKSPAGPDEDGYYTSYSVYFNSTETNDGKNVQIRVNDGKVSRCSILPRNTEGISVYYEQDCDVTGLVGDIYKVVEFGAGHDNSDNKIGFIMTDGTVQYIPLLDAIRNNDFSIKGKLNIDGYVTDAFDILVGVGNDEMGSGWGSTIFTLNDGSTIEYGELQLDN